MSSSLEVRRKVRMCAKPHSQYRNGAHALHFYVGEGARGVSVLRARAGLHMRMSCRYVFPEGALKQARAGSLGALRAAKVRLVPSESTVKARGAAGARGDLRMARKGPIRAAIGSYSTMRASPPGGLGYFCEWLRTRSGLHQYV